MEVLIKFAFRDPSINRFSYFIKKKKQIKDLRALARALQRTRIPATGDNKKKRPVRQDNSRLPNMLK